MTSTNLFLDTDYDSDGRSLSRRGNIQSRNSSRNALHVTRKTENTEDGGVLEGMESGPVMHDHQNVTNDGKHSHEG